MKSVSAYEKIRKRDGRIVEFDPARITLAVNKALRAAGSSSEKLAKIPAIIEGIISTLESTEFERTHFSEFSDFSHKFLTVYYMKTDDYMKYMDTQQKINLAILDAFEKEGLKLAFPTQTIILKKNAPL